MSKEFKTKLNGLKAFLKTKGLRGVLLSTRANYSWLSCGHTNRIRSDVEKGVASLWVTTKGVELWCNNIEEPRFKAEEAKGLPSKYQVHSWYEGAKLASLTKGASDDGAFGTKNLKDEIAQLRWSLTPEEISRYRKVGKLSGDAMNHVARKVKPDWTEQQVEAELSRELVLRGLEASVILVGADERLKRYRHPLPTAHKIKKIVMMVICAKGYGLIANLTRIVHFGKIPADLRRRHEACVRVECAMWHETVPGVEARDVFQAAALEYARQGFEGEWKKHHQGGPTGYETRDYLATPNEKRRIQLSQGVAWNPSITGTKSEDTVLVTAKGLEVLTPTTGWPMLKVKYGDKDFLRPDILEK